jgi:hypothetical protein
MHGLNQWRKAVLTQRGDEAHSVWLDRLAIERSSTLHQGTPQLDTWRAVREHRNDAATFGNQQREQLDVRVASMLEPGGDGVAARRRGDAGSANFAPSCCNSKP